MGKRQGAVLGRLVPLDIRSQHMRRKLSAAAVTSAAVVAFAFAPAGASAAHCVAPDSSSPGFSYFGTVHVKGDAHGNEGVGRPHAGTPGASNCNDSGNPSPSERAPGQKNR